MKNFRLLPVLFIFIIFSCGSPEGDYYKLLEKYSQGEITDSAGIYDKLIKVFSASVLDSDSFFFSKNIILKSGGEEPEIIFPNKIILNADESIEDNLTFGCMNNSNILLGNNKGFCVFNMDGDPVAIYKTTGNEIIDAMSLKSGSVIFLSKGKLYEYNISSKSSKAFSNGEFFAPYKAYYRSFIYSSEKYSALITGIAGSYYISVYDMAKGEVRLKNIDSSAFDFAVEGSSLYYLKGGTGNWSVMKYDIAAKDRSTVRQVSKLENIFFTGYGFVVVSEGRGRIENYSGEKEVLPGNWTVLGTCDDMLLIDYDGKTYLMDFNVLIQKLKEISIVEKKS